MKTALITGVAGQDGSYLAEQLLALDYTVVGAVRNVARAQAALPVAIRDHVQLVNWDPLDQNSIEKLIGASRPHEIYNFAAYSSGERMHEDPVGMAEINGKTPLRILAAIKHVDRNIRFCQASSSEMFGLASGSPQSEQTPFNPRSPYGEAKVYAHSMIRQYRERDGLFATSAILFNHESPRRRLEFVTRKVTHAAAQIKLGLAASLALGNLEARRDWSFAGDIVDGMRRILQAQQPSDYVLASGVTHSVRELCDIAFQHVGLDYKKYVREDAQRFRPAEPVQLVGDPARAEQELGWKRKVDFRSLIAMMVEADFAMLKEQKGIDSTP